MLSFSAAKAKALCPHEKLEAASICRLVVAGEEEVGELESQKQVRAGGIKVQPPGAGKTLRAGRCLGGASPGAPGPGRGCLCGGIGAVSPGHPWIALLTLSGGCPLPWAQL